MMIKFNQVLIPQRHSPDEARLAGSVMPELDIMEDFGAGEYPSQMQRDQIRAHHRKYELRRRAQKMMLFHSEEVELKDLVERYPD